MFEPFFTTKAVGRAPGSGWRRSTASCAQSGGHITVSQRDRAGHDVPHPPAPVDAAEVAVDPDSSVQKLPGGTEHILLVEDDSSVRRLAKDLLTRLGYSVTEAASGRAGIALGSDDTRHFDLLLCDVILGT